MNFEEIVPHLNKISTLYLKNNKRKVGWLFADPDERKSNKHLNEVYFVCVQKGKKLTDAIEKNDIKRLREDHESILLKEIIRIRSSK
jgi:hypothetical protein